MIGEFCIASAFRLHRFTENKTNANSVFHYRGCNPKLLNYYLQILRGIKRKTVVKLQMNKHVA